MVLPHGLNFKFLINSTFKFHGTFMNLILQNLKIKCCIFMLNYRVVFIFQSGIQADQSYKSKSSSQILIALNIPFTKITIYCFNHISHVKSSKFNLRKSLQSVITKHFYFTQVIKEARCCRSRYLRRSCYSTFTH